MNQREQIREAIRAHGPMSIGQIAEHLSLDGEARNIMSAQLRHMARGGYVTRTEDGKYRLTGKPVRPILSKIPRRPGGTAQLVREVLRGGPATTSEIRIATGITRAQASTAMHDMERMGVIGHDNGPQGQRRYRLLREVRTRLSPEERKRRRLECQRKYYQAKHAAAGGRTREQIRAAVAAKAAEAQRKRAEREQRRVAKREAQRKAESQARAEKEQAKRAKMLARLEAEATPVSHAAVPAETYEQWVARTGKQAERLPAAWEVRP